MFLSLQVERSHCRLHQKIHYDMQKCTKMGVNWAKNHPDYMRILNNKAREELQYRSPFEIYYGRKSNELVMAGIDVPQNVKTQVKSIKVLN